MTGKKGGLKYLDWNLCIAFPCPGKFRYFHSSNTGRKQVLTTEEKFTCRDCPRAGNQVNS